tara:strand:- start:884 stop:1498 length:615 start_codon:yes stop_codon:yes gene_type:complete
MIEDKIYIIHYDKLIERKIHIEKEINDFTNVEWVLNKNPNDLSDSELSLFNDGLSDGSKSLTMKHIETFKRIVKGDNDYAVVFEDDIILNDNFNNYYQLIKEQFLLSDFEICFIGNGCGLEVGKLIEGQYLYDSNGNSRCTDSFIIKKSLCKKLLDIYIEYDKYFVNIDFIMNKWFTDYNIKTSWSGPSIITQGSQNGSFKRSI